MALEGEEVLDPVPVGGGGGGKAESECDLLSNLVNKDFKRTLADAPGLFCGTDFGS